MEIHHFISSIDRFSGGPSQSTTSLIREIAKITDTQVYLHTGVSSNPIVNRFDNEKAFLNFYKLNRIGGFEFNGKLKFDSNSTIFHGNGLWDYMIHQMCKYAKRNGISYVISPRGMLEPWALEQARFKKLLALFIYQLSDLRNASCLHATSLKEALNYRQLGLKRPIAVIPNGIDLTDINPPEKINKSNKNKILFLSRIHNGKGLENLLLAWKNIPEYLKSSWTLEIVGDGKESYVQGLINQLEILEIKDQVKFIGPLYNEEKINAFQTSDIFVLPTYSENFGMAIAEAMAFGLPVITTKGAPWEELETHYAGWWIEIGVEPLAQALIEAMSTPPSKLIEMGKNGRKLIEDKYSIESVAKQMTELYEWILQKRDKPDFVI